MKKWICLLLCLTLTLGIIAGCKGRSAENSTSGSAAATTTTTTTQSTNREPGPFDLEALQAQIPEELKETMKPEAIRYLRPRYDPSEWEYEVTFTFYAVFDSVYVVLVDVGNGYMEYETGELVDGIRFVYRDNLRLYAYTNGQFYLLQEALDAQLIDHSQLETVAENYYSVHPDRIPDLTPGEYSDTLSDGLRSQIVAFYGREGKYDDEDTVAGKQYYGTYNGYVILLDIGQEDIMFDMDIDGRSFKWGSSMNIWAYKNGTVNHLSYIYEASWITGEDLDQIYQKHRAFFEENHNWDYDMEFDEDF